MIDGEGVLDTAYDKIKVCNNVYGIDEKTLYEAVEHFNLLLKDSGDNEAAVAILKRLVPAFKENHYIKKIETSRGHDIREELKTVPTEDRVH